MMKKEITKAWGHQLFKYTFDSLWSLIDYTDKAPYNPDFYGRDSENGSFDFTGTHSYDEARSLCLNGGLDSEFERFMTFKEELDCSLQETRSRTLQFNHFIGEVPNVPLYLIGHPMNMIAQRKEELSEDKIVNVYYNCAVVCVESRESIFHRGIILLSFIDYLESLGYKVDLHIFSLIKEESQILHYEFDLKNIDEPLDYRNLFFVLTHPSFLRRILFKLMEKTPGLNSDWANGYGYPADRTLIEKIYPDSPNTFIFVDPRHMGICGTYLEKDFDAAIKYLCVEDKLGVNTKSKEDKIDGKGGRR
jgi:hypothetical protein